MLHYVKEELPDILSDLENRFYRYEMNDKPRKNNYICNELTDVRYNL